MRIAVAAASGGVAASLHKARHFLIFEGGGDELLRLETRSFYGLKPYADLSLLKIHEVDVLLCLSFSGNELYCFSKGGPLLALCKSADIRQSLDDFLFGDLEIIDNPGGNEEELYRYLSLGKR